ncbi:hypothetical protein SCG7086_BF_00010 [Chlamydiales bacterium SCGC AG-110-P3]|nr:hypothetical protein SCG7086_BF_00010 [Chlamydiales bacterium SCGC AG-110-P3]
MKNCINGLSKDTFLAWFDGCGVALRERYQKVSEEMHPGLEILAGGRISAPTRIRRDTALKDRASQLLHSSTLPLRVSGATITELFSAVISAGASVVAKKDFDPKIPDQTRTPVLFLHGLKANQAAHAPGRYLLRLYSRFTGRDLGAFYSMNYANLFSNDKSDTFDTYADRVFKKVQAIYDQTGRVPSVVCHSMGGLVCTRLAQKLEAASETGKYRLEGGADIELSNSEKSALRISTIVTLATPFHGSRVADAVVASNHLLGRESINVERSMMTDGNAAVRGPVLAELRRYAMVADQTGAIRFFNAGSTVDAAVPSGYFVTQDPRRQYESCVLGHMGMRLAPSVWYQVGAWLTEAHDAIESQNQ